MNSSRLNLSRALMLLYAVVAIFPPPTGGTTSGSSTVVFSISGENQLDPGSHVWDNPIALYDSVYFDVATLLNSFDPDSTTSGTTSGLTAVNATTTPGPTEEGLALWVIIVIAGGGGVLFIGVVVAIWLSVRRSAKVHTDSGNHTRMGFSARVYPPPHAYSKVIQVALVHHQLPS